MTARPLAVLVVCTANQCRSPMGEAIARRALERAGIDAAVASAGTHAVEGVPATEGAELTVHKLGLDVSRHLSRPIDEALIAHASMVWCMERMHVVEVCRVWPDAFAKTFTVKDLARRTIDCHRHPSEPVDHWLLRVGEGRTTAEMLGHSPDDDIADPIGRSLRRYRRAAESITLAVETVVVGLNGPPPASGHEGG